MKAEKLKTQIIEQIGELFSDTTVSQEKTLDFLEEIEGEIQFKISAIKEDLKRKEKEQP